MLFRRNRGSEEGPQAQSRGLSVVKMITGLGLAGLAGALVLLLIATVSILDIRAKIFARDAIFEVKDAVSTIDYYNAEISGWQLGVLADVAIHGPEEGLDGTQAFNHDGFESSAADIQQIFARLPA